MLWIWLVLLYGILKGFREICKKKALETCSSIEVLLIYSFVAFLLVCPDAPNAMGLAPKYYFLIALKSFIIFVAWICGFNAIKQLPLSFYGVLDLSRVLFSTLLGIIVLHEVMSPFNIIGLVLVGTGLVMLGFKREEKHGNGHNDTRNNSYSDTRNGSYSDTHNIDNSPNHNNQSEPPNSPLPLRPKSAKKYLPHKFVFLALMSAFLNAVSGLMDKMLMLQMNSSQLQFWYMLFLCSYYAIYALIVHAGLNIKKAITNKWIWLLSIMFIIADRALFVANGIEASHVTVMTLLKQVCCVVTIFAGKFIYKEKNIGYKFVCATVVIVGIVLGVM